MRLPLLPKSDLTPDQAALYGGFYTRASAKASLFRTIGEDGALLGPWSVWLHTPSVGEPLRQMIEAIGALPGLSVTAAQAVTLATVAHFDAAYEIQAHAAQLKAAGLSDGQIAALVAGDMPPGLDEETTTAVEVARRLLAGGVLPAPLHRRAVTVLGQDGLAAIVYLVGQYCLVAACLNAYDVPSEEPTS